MLKVGSVRHTSTKIFCYVEFFGWNFSPHDYSEREAGCLSSSEDVTAAPVVHVPIACWREICRGPLRNCVRRSRGMGRTAQCTSCTSPLRYRWRWVGVPAHAGESPLPAWHLVIYTHRLPIRRRFN